MDDIDDIADQNDPYPNVGMRTQSARGRKQSNMPRPSFGHSRSAELKRLTSLSQTISRRRKSKEETR